MQKSRQSKKFHLLSGACFAAAAALFASGALGHNPASVQDWVGAGLFVVAAAFQFVAFFTARRA
jgi:hypothetical protein